MLVKTKIILLKILGATVQN